MNCFAHLATLLRPLPGKMDRSDQKLRETSRPRDDRRERSSPRGTTAAGRSKGLFLDDRSRIEPTVAKVKLRDSARRWNRPRLHLGREGVMDVEIGPVAQWTRNRTIQMTLRSAHSKPEHTPVSSGKTGWLSGRSGSPTGSHRLSVEWAVSESVQVKIDGRLL